jgi:hypothetical protein
MIPQAAREHPKPSKKLMILAVEATEQARKLHEALARRAYQLFERRGLASRHALEDWRQAEAEMVRSCCSGQMSVDGTLWMGTDAAVFKEDSIEIWVAPRQVTVCGKSRTGGDGQMIFHVINLTCDVDPSSVTAKIDGRSLDIFLKKAGAEHEAKRVMAAATA